MELRPKSLQTPHPPVAVAAGNTPSTVELAGRHGFQMLTGDFNNVKRLNKFNTLLAESQRAAGRPVERSKMACCRVIYVAESDKQAREDMRESYERTIAWEIVNTPHHQVDRIPKGGTLQDVTYDYLVDTHNLFIGGPDTVTKRIEEFYQDVGGFGLMMIHAGRDYATREKRARSMKLFMDEVAPRLRPLDADKNPPKPSDRLRDAYDNERSPELHAALARYKIA
jgi:alkanesulfonate monooxygenase SsuD/methylene tetrahydromethanopterin reductase-like flavin-dependent oxidoreductase (luciferase family)